MHLLVIKDLDDINMHGATIKILNLILRCVIPVVLGQ